MTNDDLISIAASGDVNVFYNSRTWRKKSREIIRRDRYECQLCKKRGKYRRAHCVHHVREIKAHPELAFEDDNLMALCRQCHNEIHNREFTMMERAKPTLTDERW